jgi:hypothetical protein
VRDSWPDGCGRVPNTESSNLEDMNDWEIVPDTFQEMCDWAVVGCKRTTEGTDRARNRILLYRELEERPSGVKHGVTLRLQGFIQSCDLRPLGNWDG